jgi:glycosyltransferase involved in cell wall biosynthesis
LISTIHATEFGRNNGLHNDTQRYISNVEWWLTYESWRVICNSKYMENQLMSFFQLPLDKIRMIPNGVQIENFQTKAVDKEFKTNYSSYDEKLVFYVGRLVQEKGVHILIQAIPHVLRQYNNVKFVISGTGPYADHLKKMAIDLGINNKIYFTGFIDDDTRNKLFKISDTAVFPSLYEPFGIVALEGMAAQVPVIVSDTGGLREIVNHGKDGMKFTCGSSEDLAAQIVTLLRNPQMAARIALSGLKKVKELYNWELISEHTLEVYKEVLKQNYSLSYTQKA